MKKKVQAFMMWFFTLLLLFSFQSWAQPEFEVTTLMDKTGANLPLAQFGTANQARSGALFQNRYMIVPSRVDATNVWVWDTHNPDAAPFTLNLGTGIIQFGLFEVNYAQTKGDKIYVSNLTLGSNAAHPFRVYRWNGLVGQPELILDANLDWGRLGDSFSIVGDLETDGYLVAHINSGGAGQKKFKVWHFENGVVQNLETPDEIVLNANVNMNSYGVYNAIPGETDKFLVTGNGMGIVVANFVGDSLTGWNTSIIPGRTMEPHIFYLNGKRYLTYVVNNEGNAVDGAYYDIIDLSEGNDVIEAFQTITTLDELAAKRVHRFVLGAGDNGLSATNQVYVQENGNILIAALVVDRGFVVEELSVPSDVFFAEDFNDGNAAARWSFTETGGTNVVDFAFDYEAAGIPLLGDETDGIGLKMAVNTAAPGLLSAVMAFPNGQSFEGEYVLSFDFWMNFQGTTGTTEHAIFGAGHTSTAIQTPAAGSGSVDGTPGTGPSNNGIDYTMTPDNGASRDVRVFVDGAELLGAAGGFADPNLQSTQHPPYSDAYSGLVPGNQWLAITIEVLADRTIFKVNGQVWAETMQVADPGNIMLGYIDFFGGSVADATSYLVFDNIKVAEKEYEEPLARVQLIHNSADAAVAAVDLYVNGELELENVPFRTATPFMDAPAGVDINLVITPTGAPIENGVPVTINFEDGKTYVVVAAGNVSATGYDPVVPFDLFVYDLGREAAINPSNVDVLAFHGSTDAPTVTVWETGVGAGQLISDFEFGEFAGYLSLALNDYILEIRDETGTVKVAAYEAPLATLGLQGQALTVLASGFLNPEANSDGEPFGLFVALASGGPLVELPFYDDTVIISEFPYLQDFESGNFDGTGYVVINVDGSTYEWVVTDVDNHTPGGQYTAFHRWNTAANEEGWLISPPVVMPENAEFVLSFWSRNQWADYYGKNSVWISTGSADPVDGDFTEVWSPESVENVWGETVIDLGVYAGQTIYFAFVYEGEDAHGWYLDDIYIGEPVELPAYATLFEFSVAGGDYPTWMGTNNERGIASYGDNVYAVSRTGGNFVYVLDRMTGAVTGQLNTTGIQSVGTFHINDIEVSDDGVVVAANMASGGGATFILYEMDATDPADPILQFTLPTEGGRIGDKITLVGGFDDGGATLYAADANNPKVYKWTLTNGVFGAPTVITLDFAQGNTPVVSPLPDGKFYYTAAGQGVSKVNADGTKIGTIAGEIIPTGSTAIKYFGKDGNDEMIGVYLYGENHEHLVVVRVVDGDPELAEIEFTTPSMYGAANGNGTGDVAFEPAPDGKNVDLYVLGTNNGIGGYRSLMLDLVFPDYSVQVPPTEDQFVLHWDVASTANTVGFRAEHYSVLVSNTTNDPAEFVTVFEETLSTDIPGWTYRPRQVDISDYAGDDIYVAFRHHNVTDMDRLVIDNVKIVMIPVDDSKEEMVIFLEDFQGGVVEEIDEDWLPAGWLTVDADNDGFNWYFGARNGDGAMRSQSYDATEGALTPDNWLFTPAIFIGVEEGPFDVTFNVNMTYAANFNPASDIVYFTGSIFGWAAPGAQPENQTMSRVGESMIWTKTIVLEPGTYAYKYFLNAGWDGGEWQGGADRSLTVVGDMTVNDWFGSLTDPTSVPVVEASALNLYPNPARTVLNIVSGDMIRELRVIDMLGQVVYAADVVGESHQINVASFRNGIYFVQILTSQGITTQKVQIQR